MNEERIVYQISEDERTYHNAVVGLYFWGLQAEFVEPTKVEPKGTNHG